MAKITILDPVASPPEVDPDPGPNAGGLQDKVVGLRLDSAWKSYEWVLEIWEPKLVAHGARVVRWVAGNRVGDAGERTSGELKRFAADVDIGIVGLGN